MRGKDSGRPLVSNKFFYLILFLLILLAVSFLVLAYGTNNPAVFGHSRGEIGGVAGEAVLLDNSGSFSISGSGTWNVNSPPFSTALVSPNASEVLMTFHLVDSGLGGGVPLGWTFGIRYPGQSGYKELMLFEKNSPIPLDESSNTLWVPFDSNGLLEYGVLNEDPDATLRAFILGYRE